MWHRALDVAQSFGGQRLSSRPSRRRVEGSCIGFWKSKANSTFCKVVKQKGEAFWHRNTQVLRKRRVPKLQKAALFAIVCRFLCGTELRFGIEIPLIYATALCQNPRIRHSPNSGTVCRFPPRYAFSPLIPAVWGFGLGLLRSQGFIGAKASLDPLCRALWHGALFWQPLQPWFVKETAFFFAKAQNCKKLRFLR